MLEQYGLVLALVCAVIAIAYGLWTASWINKQPAGNLPTIAQRGGAGSRVGPKCGASMRG